MLLNPSNRCQWPVSKVSSKKIDPFIPNERLEVRVKFRVCDWYMTMRSPSKNCLSRPLSCHLPKGNFEVYCALICILRDKYKQNFEKNCLGVPVMDNFRVCLFSMAKASVFYPIISCIWRAKKAIYYHSSVHALIPACSLMMLQKKSWKNWLPPRCRQVFTLACVATHVYLGKYLGYYFMVDKSYSMY